MHSVNDVRPHFVTTTGRIDIGNHGTSIFFLPSRHVTKKDIALVIAEFGNVLRLIIIRVNRPNFKARMVRVKIANISRITIAKPGRVTHRPVVIQSSSSIYDFVKSIAIQVANNHIEVALTEKPLARSFGLVEPALFQVLSVKVVSHHVSRRIVTASRNQARMYAIEVGRRRQEAVAAVAVSVAPVEAQRIITTKLSNIARRNIVNRRDFGTIGPSEHRQVFRPRNNNSRSIAVILGGIPNHLALAVDCTVTGLHDHFGLAVAIVVINLELRVMRTRTNVPAKANTPKFLSIKFVRINKDRARIGAFHLLRIVLVVVRNPLHHQFIFAIAIQVANAHIVGIISADRLFGIRHYLTCGAIQFKNFVRNRDVAIRNGRIQHHRRFLLGAFLAIHHGCYRILRRSLPCSVQEIRPRRFPYRGYFFAIAIKIELRIRFFRP